MGNRKIETQTRTNDNGKLINKTFNYSTNNLNQYTDKIIYNPNNEEIVDEIIQEPETPIETGTGIIEVIDVEILTGNQLETTEEIIDNTTEIEPLVELNGKLIYDKNGNMIGNILNNKRQYIYSYDYKNRLVKVEKTIYKTIEGSETNEVEEIVKIIQYKYDNLDRRIQKIFNNGSYRNYYYSNKDIILEENYTKPNNNGISKLKTSKYFINGNSIDDVLAMEKVDYKTRKVTEEYTNKKGQIKIRTINETYTETNTYYYHKNHLNSIVAITDNLGNILEEYEYDVFGKPYSKDLLTGEITNLKASAIGNTRLFTGREYERGLQLYYNRARYYNPELGRFISRDPIDISDDVNLYSYVWNSPVSYTDILGLAKQFGINFVREYDKFLLLEKELGKITNELAKALYQPRNISLINNTKKLRDKTYNAYILQENITKELHYSRNDYNGTLPRSIREAEFYEWEEPKLAGNLLLGSFFHQDFFEEGTERKLVSPDGHNEVMFFADGTHDGEEFLDKRYIGTYNIFSPNINSKMHRIYDMDSYLRWGN